MKTLDQGSTHAIYGMKHMAKPVHFFCEAAKAVTVSLVGDFNNWDAAMSPMTRRVDGWWFIEVDLPHGHHRYRFLVDGKPVLDPRANGIERDHKGEGVSVIAVS